MRLNFRIFVCACVCMLAHAQGSASQILQDSVMMHWGSAETNFRLNGDSPGYNSDVWANLIVGSASFTSLSQSLFGFHSGIDTKVAKHLLLGIGFGYVRGSDDVRKATYNNTHQLLGSLYGRVFGAHNELDFVVYGNMMFKEMMDSSQSIQTNVNPYAIGGKTSYGYVFRFARASFKPTISYNAYYSQQPSFLYNTTSINAQGLFYQTLELGLEYRVRSVSGSYVYIKPSYEFLLSSHHNVYALDSVSSWSDFTAPRGFVNVFVGGEIAYSEAMAFSLNASYKQAIGARDSQLGSIDMSMFNFWCGVRFGF